MHANALSTACFEQNNEKKKLKEQARARDGARENWDENRKWT